MWKIAYNILIHLLLPFFVLFALTKEKIRKTLRERLLPERLNEELSGAVWIHAASVGEAVIADNLIRSMNSLNGAGKFLVTCNTYYARDMLRNKLESPHHVCCLPFDIPFSLSRLMGAIRFEALIIIETEIWPNLIWAANKRGIPVIIVNGRISDSTVRRYRRFSFFMKHVLSGVDLVLAQSAEHRDRFISIGMDPEQVIDGGNMKYYREMKIEQGAAPEQKAITFGSIKEKEIDVIAGVVKGLKAAFPDVLIFLVPRELHLISFLEDLFLESFDVMRYSVYKGLPEAKPSIVIVDTVGDLMGIYGKSTVAFVGGSLAPYGGQNILEPLFFGTPVIFGPYIENFREIAAEIIDCGAGVMVSTGEDLLAAMKNILTDAALRRRMGDEGRAVVARQKQVMARAVTAISEVIWKNSRNS
jgi:3-deoxy-D-manno-octulosonic-acid transferase